MIKWLGEGSKHRCINQLIFSQFQQLTLPLHILLQLFEQYHSCDSLLLMHLSAFSELYVYTLDSVLIIDIILPTTTSMNYSTA